MRRWHQERDIMLRRWKNEIAQHGGHSNYRVGGSWGAGAIWFGNPWLEVPVPPPACDIDTCHCFKGMGYYRKMRPFDCGKPRCGSCHWEKFWTSKARATQKRKAIEDSMYE